MSIKVKALGMAILSTLAFIGFLGIIGFIFSNIPFGIFIFTGILTISFFVFIFYTIFIEEFTE